MCAMIFYFFVIIKKGLELKKNLHVNRRIFSANVANAKGHENAAMHEEAQLCNGE